MAQQEWKGPLKRLDSYRWEIPQSYKPEMRTRGIIYADEVLIQQIVKDFAPEQVANVATMPGIVGPAMAMPDIHWGYGMPVGGVAAFDAEEGVISPGAVGYDINCGVKLLRTTLTEEDVRPRLKELVDALFANVPSGVGSHGKVRVSPGEIREVLQEGISWAIDKGYGWEGDPETTESRGCLKGADPSKVSDMAIKRGVPQLGSLGAGNHFLEVQKVDTIHDPKAASALGLFPGQVTVLIHSGSRGLGHQVATDYIRVAERSTKEHNIQLPDRQLACMPILSKEGEDYYGAMAGAANFGWANRQLITHWVRQSFEKVIGKPAEEAGLEVVYDVGHNTAKPEEHFHEGRRVKVYVHRKGATRAFPPGHPEIPEAYRSTGQPVLIPGNMGTYSFVLVGSPGAMQQTFGSTCHGAGRTMSRAEATRRYRAHEVTQDLQRQGIYVHAASREGIVEEAPGAYKDSERVVRVCEGAGLSKVVAKLVPMGVVKG
jgi:tRNA-splicing ligase RtcB